MLFLIPGLDSCRFAISVCPSGEFQIQHNVITIRKFLTLKMCTRLHETETLTSCNLSTAEERQNIISIICGQYMDMDDITKSLDVKLKMLKN